MVGAILKKMAILLKENESHITKINQIEWYIQKIPWPHVSWVSANLWPQVVMESKDY